EHSLEATHKLLKPKNKGGIGIGRLIGAGHKDSIELLIRDYAIRGPTRTEVIDYGDEIVKAGRITLAIAEMTPHWAPRDAQMKAKWQAQSAEMRQTALDFVVAAQSRDHEKISTTAKRLNESCAVCHKMIRYER